MEDMCYYSVEEAKSEVCKRERTDLKLHSSPETHFSHSACIQRKVQPPKAWLNVDLESYLSMLHAILWDFVKVQLLPCGLTISLNVYCSLRLSDCQATCRFLLSAVSVKKLSHPEAQLEPCLHCLCSLLFTRCFQVCWAVCMCVCVFLYVDQTICVCVSACACVCLLVCAVVGLGVYK